ncbi:MAG: hypothetical protein ACYDAC_06575 [Candidatus Dormibacteria bacterium]
MSGDLPPATRLLYRVHPGWRPLPAWARFMLEAGDRAASTRPDGARLVIALSVPARAYAAALATAAAVVSAFREDPPGNDAAQHFDYLASLPEGTAISHHLSNKVEHGRLAGVEIHPEDATPRVRIRLRKEDRLLPVGLCTRVQVIDERGRLSARQRTLVKDPEFLANALPEVDITSLSATTRLDCVVIGVQRTLEAELSTREFAAGSDHETYEGSLQGIARARDIAGSGEAYRSAVVAAGSDDGDAPISASPPRVAIFDGARAFNNWRSRYPESNWLVVFDRGLPSSDDGAAVINQGYAMRLAESDVLAGLDIPPGIETLCYLERR